MTAGFPFVERRFHRRYVARYRQRSVEDGETVLAPAPDIVVAVPQFNCAGERCGAGMEGSPRHQNASAPGGREEYFPHVPARIESAGFGELIQCGERLAGHQLSVEIRP